LSIEGKIASNADSCFSIVKTRSEGQTADVAAYRIASSLKKANVVHIDQIIRSDVSRGFVGNFSSVESNHWIACEG